MTGCKTYRYKYRTFAVTNGGQARPLNQDGTPRKKNSDAFYETYQEWCKLPNKEDYAEGSI